jgi:transposase
MQIAAEAGAVVPDGHTWRVRSQSIGSRKYRVNPHAVTCSCPDHEETGEKCKHLYAVLVVMSVEETPEGTTVTTTRQTYSQDWSVYNAAQCAEKDTFMALLAELCSTIEQPVQVKGRPRLPLGEMVFAMVYKVFSGFSTRRFTSDLRDACERGLITKAPHFNSVSNYMSDEDLTPLLQELITLTALPLRGLETEFAVDSSGFNSGNVMRWLDTKHGTRTSQHQREWVKAHLMCGTRTNVVTSVEVSDWKGGDTTYFPALVEATAKEFAVEEVSADKAYLTKKNVELVESVGATPFVPFKKNTRDPGMIADTAWTRMYHRFMADREMFMAHYHRRSNVETTFSMIKMKFGASLRSKSTAGQVNEVLCKVLAHNIVCVAQAAAEFGIDATFGTPRGLVGGV